MSIPHYSSLLAAKSGSGARRKVVCPFDQEPIATVELSDGDDVESALKQAYEHFRRREAWLTPSQRIGILRRTAELMTGQANELAMLIASEGGKPLPDAKVEVARAIDGMVTCAELLRSSGGRVIPMDINAASANRVAFTCYEPIGVVVAVSAFNHPLNLIVHQVAPAVAAGCPFIVKPASDTPLSCLRLVAMLRQAGLPEAAGQVTVTNSSEVATALVTDPRVAFFSFIGSADVGWKLHSKLAAGTRSALEHGGVAPVIVAADADLDAAASKLCKGGFYHAGQVCVSVQRIYAHRSIAQQLAERLAKLAATLRVGDARLEDTEVGPMIRPNEVDRVHEWVQEAVSAGAQLLTGGHRLEPVTCYAPTVLLEPPAHCKVSTSEVFGPVVCVYAYDDLGAAIERANALPVAFQAAVFTRDYATAMRVFRSIDASAVMLNDHTAFRTDWMPFAGLRHAGLGVGGIPYTLHDMQIEKMFVGPI
ncbi:acyl-CoA reductase-like NAD-dependent aldehyde dehydrogenase [Variovorax boronicumulans]|uniref:aldehyde dehydrogenase family protein n=1 Tax=Variovorax boronicumulans TaxID=436515 RepID=UPI002785E4B0|nr:aldehyde dehydrogenase family protein [Variovorax boronicumulans]MDP9995694.1 acyl-CoA reductase-like NAD-dependent aldehyde dehydrogenase [Variovorax boronicumulans]MDQ0006841.1 acyl-CoA reductase-like NAD-dependent aldehyde dehydrogenase [Variovorax boronicumulans]